ncbi:PREDICTED: uncharacterized protein LOC109243160 [Nicotiana attenuata]|uniref:uncharacterized protein LOC109243160 n=1 Tax=Nicotiana attenuata TaxID=49451 RepID=UPI00090509BD|nr:PREDICTED: uncharacterized protein LOC109243160 [Nicotiana attenuata]
MQHGNTKKVTIADDGVFRLQGRICMHTMNGLSEMILKKAHTLRYSIHPGTAKMYHTLKQHYWWIRMKKVIVIKKKDIVDYVERLLNYQQDILRARVIDFGDQWDPFYPPVEFAYNNSYQSSIQMDLYEALYGRQCRVSGWPSPVGWFEPAEARLLGTDMVHDALEKVNTAQSIK